MGMNQNYISVVIMAGGKTIVNRMNVYPFHAMKEHNTVQKDFIIIILQFTLTIGILIYAI